MRIFGFTIKAKKEPRYAPYEDVQALNDRYHDLAEQYAKLFRAYEAMRLKVYRDSKQNGDELAPAREDPAKPAVPQVQNLRPGDDPGLIFGRF